MSERKEKVEKLQKFLQRSGHNGGIFLLTGPRGVGKTWLVDQALSKPSPSGFWSRVSRYFSGRIGLRQRLIQARKPRGLNRVLLKVDVDSVFWQDDQGAEMPNPNRLTQQLLHNVICGLTTAIDSRFSIRQHGRVLRERIGFWHYWFGYGLLRPAESVEFWVISLLTGLLCFKGFLALLLEFSGLLPVRDTAPGLLWHSVYVAVPVFLVMLLLPLLALRWRDWQALHQISNKLYNCVHASQYQQKQAQSNEQSRTMTINWALLLVLMCAAYSFWYLLPETAKTYVGGVLNDPAKLASALTLISLVSVLTWAWSSNRKHQQEDNAVFDQTNPDWLINLLRRYLFLCHRCGIEPVLVLDELDKLDDLDVLVKSPAPPRKNISAKKVDKPNDRLNHFLMALARLKASLGAEFLWILIGGPKIHDALQKDRHYREDANLGLLATVLHQEEVLGPSARSDAERYITKQWLPIWRKKFEDWSISPDLNHWLWLRSYGNFSTLIRECEHLRAPMVLSQFERDVIDTVDALWSEANINNQLDFNFRPLIVDTTQKEWLYLWLRSGILDAANHFFRPFLPTRTLLLALNEMPELQTEAAKQFGDSTAPEVVAMYLGLPSVLRAAGAKLLYRELKSKKIIEDVDGNRIRIGAKYTQV